jgi:hypothetical protein
VSYWRSREPTSLSASSGAHLGAHLGQYRRTVAVLVVLSVRSAVISPARAAGTDLAALAHTPGAKGVAHGSGLRPLQRNGTGRSLMETGGVDGNGGK